MRKIPSKVPAPPRCERWSSAFGANVRGGGAADPVLWFFLSHPHGADQAFGWPPVRVVPGRAVGYLQTRHRYSGTSAFSYFAEPSASSVPCGLEVCLSASTCLCFTWIGQEAQGPCLRRRAWRNAPAIFKLSAPAYAVVDLRLFFEGRRLAEDPITLAFTTSITRTRTRGAPQGALLQQVAARPLRCPKSDTQENLAAV